MYFYYYKEQGVGSQKQWGSNITKLIKYRVFITTVEMKNITLVSFIARQKLQRIKFVFSVLIPHTQTKASVLVLFVSLLSTKEEEE